MINKRQGEMVSTLLNNIPIRADLHNNSHILSVGLKRVVLTAHQMFKLRITCEISLINFEFPCIFNGLNDSCKVNTGDSLNI